MASLPSHWQSWLPKVLLVAALTLWAYWPALRGEFIWDDEWYITLNPYLSDATGLWKFWFQPGSWVEYYPIEETVLWLQWQLWGTHTLGYHLTNLFLHFTSALLVWQLLSRFGLRFAWVGGLIFAIHPVQVDSVAYISELKNTLSLPIFLLAMMAWLDYDESRSRKDYKKARDLYIIAMLCKISMVPFAAVILLHAWWKRGRVTKDDLRACAPFVLIAVVLSALTLWAGIVYAKANYFVHPETSLTGIFSRIDAVGLNLTVYFARCFLPVDIMLVYSKWRMQPDNPLQYLPWLVLLGIGYLLWIKRRSWGRHALLGLGFFLLMLSPFLGLTGPSYMDFMWVMDHFLYIPIIGLIGLVVAGMEGIDAQLPTSLRPVTIGLTAVLISLMTWVSHTFSGYFLNGEIFWTHVLQRNPTVWLAHYNLGCKLLELERYPEALAEGNIAIQLRPTFADSYYNQGFALQKLGQNAEAEQQYRKALEMAPGNPKYYLDLGKLLRIMGKMDEAESIFRQGTKVAPDDVSMNIDLAEILFTTGRIPEAINIYERLADLHPEMAQIQYDLGVALLKSGQLPEAADHLLIAVTLEPTMTAAHKNLGVILAQTGHLPQAIEQFQTVVQADPTDGTVRDNLGLAFANSGRLPESIEQFQQALQINPTDALARTSLPKLQAALSSQSHPEGTPAK